MLDADVRLARRIRRDTVERGRDINSVLEQASITFLKYVILQLVQFLGSIVFLSAKFSRLFF